MQIQAVKQILVDQKKVLLDSLKKEKIIAREVLGEYKKYLKSSLIKVITGPRRAGKSVLSFQLKNGFRFIKVLNNYLYDKRSLNYASFIEWLNPHHRVKP